MGRLIRPPFRRIFGGPTGQKTGLGTLAFTNGGVINPAPNWMRGGAAGTVAGWITTTAAVANFSRLFYFNNEANNYVVDCYAETGSNRWQFLITTNGVARGTCFINGSFPASGTTLGFALGWRNNRIFGKIGAQNGVGATIDAAIPIGGLTRFYMGNRHDGARQLSANFHAVDFFDDYLGETNINALAARPLPVWAPRPTTTASSSSPANSSGPSNTG